MKKDCNEKYDLVIYHALLILEKATDFMQRVQQTKPEAAQVELEFQ